jgi:hypothetical protein
MYIPLWRRLLPFIIDARLLRSGHSLQATPYAVQYTSMCQSVVDNVAVVEMAMQRRIERESLSTVDKTEFQKGVRRLMVLAFSSSGVMEIGGPLATAILLDSGAAKFSCLFERLHMMNDEVAEASVVSRGNQLVKDTSIRRYMTRPRYLEACSWYDFCA